MSLAHRKDFESVVGKTKIASFVSFEALLKYPGVVGCQSSCVVGRQVGSGSLWHGLWQFAAVAMGRHFDMSAFQLHRSRRIRISSTQDDVAFQIDGDPGGSLPVEIEVLPQHLTLIVDG